MHNSVYKSALVTKHVSSLYSSDEDYDEIYALHRQTTQDVCNFIASVNPDKRAIAIGGNDEIWRWDTQSTTSEEYSVLTFECMMHLPTLILAMINPQNMLITSAEAFEVAYAWLHKNNKEVDITFVNNIYLYFFEKYYKTASNIYNFDYSVIDVQDLKEDPDTYDLVHVYAWDVFNDQEYLQTLVDKVAPGGTLVVSLTNMSTKLYVQNFEVSPYYDMHEFLKQVPNSTVVHNSAFYGHTVLVKN